MRQKRVAWRDGAGTTISSRARTRAIPAAIVTASLAGVARAESTPEASREASPETAPAASPVTTTLPVEMVAQLTGPGDPPVNDTATLGDVWGTDLGSTFMYGDEMYMIFGDTFGAGTSDWRSNTAAVITDDDPGDGVTFDRMIEDRPGHAGELLAAKRIDFDEITVIPTNGVAVRERMFLHYMSVSHWGEPGHWDLGHSGWAYSDDAGTTWTKDQDATWPGDSTFGQVAIEEHEGHLYIYGIPGGRFGGVRLARAIPENLLRIDTYEYWDGAGWASGDPEVAAEIVPPTVGELSVRWNSHYRRWIMMYLDERSYAIVIRTAPEPTGPWGDQMTVATGQEFPALYAPYQFPKWNDRSDIWFTMSMFGPYQVYLMKTRLPAP